MAEQKRVTERVGRRHRFARVNRLVAEVFALSAILVASQASDAVAQSPDILRGSVAPPPPVVEPAAGPEKQRLTAGERLWIVDEAKGELTGCRLINTMQVGGQAVRCTTRRLESVLDDHR